MEESLKSGEKKKKKKKRRSKGGVLIEQVLEGIAPFREWKGTDRSRFKIHPILFPEVAPVTTSYGCWKFNYAGFMAADGGIYLLS